MNNSNRQIGVSNVGLITNKQIAKYAVFASWNVSLGPYTIRTIRSIIRRRCFLGMTWIKDMLRKRRVHYEVSSVRFGSSSSSIIRWNRHSVTSSSSSLTWAAGAPL